MSVIAPEIHNALSQLLNALATPDNAVRTQAEEQLNNEWVNGRPDVLLMGLAEQIQGAENASVSNLAYPREINSLFSPSLLAPIYVVGGMMVGCE